MIFSQDYQAVDANPAAYSRRNLVLPRHEEEEFVQLSGLPEAQTFPNQGNLGHLVCLLWTSAVKLRKPWKSPAMRRLSEKSLEAYT